MEDLIRTEDDLVRHAGELGDVNSEAVIGASFLQLSHEYDLVANFLDRDVKILHARQVFFKLIQLVVMGCKQSLRLAFLLSVIVQIFYDRPCNRHSIVSAGTPADLIHQYQTAMTEVIEDACRLRHLHHEGGFTSGKVVAGADACKDLVDNANVGTFGGHETSHLREQDYESRLSQQ